MLHSTFTCQGTTVRSHWQRSGTSAACVQKLEGSKKKTKRERDHMFRCCSCFSVWFKNSISVRGTKQHSCREASRGQRSNPHLGLAARQRHRGDQTESHLSNITAYLASLRIMAPFPGCHRVQCCVMRLFTLKKKKTKKSDKHVLKNSAWNEWHKTLYIPVFVKACSPVCTPYFSLTLFFKSHRSF